MNETNTTQAPVLYLECHSGISGDMTVAALLDLGADEQVLRDSLARLAVPGYKIAISRVIKNNLSACDFDVILEEDESREDKHAGAHGHTHTHKHAHRNLYDINAIIDNAGLPESVQTLAKRIFLIVAAAEAKVHGAELEQVHFHEVGAIDSIVDIVAAAVCLDNLGIREVILSPLTEGNGMIRCQHGMIPVPVPATAQIAATHGLVLAPSDIQGELITPTGAAIAAAIRTADQLPPAYKILKVGLGAGKRSYHAPNVLRAMLIRPV